MVLSIRYVELRPSRLHNVSSALDRRRWQLDEDGEGATFRLPPGTDPTDTAFEVLAVLTVAGAPAVQRLVAAVDATGTPVDLTDSA